MVVGRFFEVMLLLSATARSLSVRVLAPHVPQLCNQFHISPLRASPPNYSIERDRRHKAGAGPSCQTLGAKPHCAAIASATPL